MWDLTVGLRILRPGARIWELRKKYEITTTKERVSGRLVTTYHLSTDGERKPCILRPQAFYAYTCLECGQQFETKKEKAKFCCGKHRTAYWKRQKNIRVIEAQQSLDFIRERLRSEREPDFPQISTGKSTSQQSPEEAA